MEEKNQSASHFLLFLLFMFYFNGTSESVDVAFNVFGINATEPYGPFIADENQKLKVECQGWGYPRPNVTITRHRSPDTLNVTAVEPTDNSSITTVYFEKTTECTDTDTYTCTTGNGTHVATKNIAIFVRCPPRGDDGDGGRLVVTREVQDIHEMVNVFGYPDPIELSLNKTNDNDGYGSSRSSSIVDPSKYKLSFIPGKYTGEGLVIVSLFRFDRPDNGEYMLEVTNGVGEGFEFSITVYFPDENDYDDSGEYDDEEDSDDGVATGVVVGVTVACAVVMAILGFLAGLAVEKRRKQTSDKNNRASSATIMTSLSESGSLRDTKHQIQTYDALDVRQMKDSQIRREKTQQYVVPTSSNVQGSGKETPDDIYESPSPTHEEVRKDGGGECHSELYETGDQYYNTGGDGGGGGGGSCDVGGCGGSDEQNFYGNLSHVQNADNGGSDNIYNNM